jgi:hypothetical protein
MGESQLWESIKGEVSKVVDGRTILLALPRTHHVLRVHLAGVALEERGSFSQETKERLGADLLHKSVEVLVNSDDWSLSGKPPKEVTGVVYLTQGGTGDVGITLLAAGLVRFKRPRPYTMSAYTQ